MASLGSSSPNNSPQQSPANSSWDGTYNYSPSTPNCTGNNIVGSALANMLGTTLIVSGNAVPNLNNGSTPIINGVATFDTGAGSNPRETENFTFTKSGSAVSVKGSYAITGYVEAVDQAGTVTVTTQAAGACSGTFGGPRV
jgi:hypothetical protein